MNSFHKKPSKANLLPLMDVIFLMLAVFFYLMLFMIKHEGVPVNLPSSINAEPNNVKYISLSIDKNNDLFYQKEKLVWEKLDEKVHFIKNRYKNKLIIYIAADKESQHQYFILVLDALRQNGISNVNIETNNN